MAKGKIFGIEASYPIYVDTISPAAEVARRVIGLVTRPAIEGDKALDRLWRKTFERRKSQKGGNKGR